MNIIAASCSAQDNMVLPLVRNMIVACAGPPALAGEAPDPGFGGLQGGAPEEEPRSHPFCSKRPDAELSHEASARTVLRLTFSSSTPS